MPACSGVRENAKNWVEKKRSLSFISRIASSEAKSACSMDLTPASMAFMIDLSTIGINCGLLFQFLHLLSKFLPFHVQFLA